MIDVVPHEGCDEIVAVVVERLHPHCAGGAYGCSGRGEVFRFQLSFQEAISSSLKSQQLSYVESFKIRLVNKC